MKLGKRAKKIIRTSHKIGGRILSVAAPIAGAIIAGPAGAAAGAAVGTAASYYGEKQGALASGKKGSAVKKAGRRGIKRGAIIGGGVTLGAGALALGAGTGLATSSLTAASSILGGGQKAPTSGTEGMVFEKDVYGGSGSQTPGAGGSQDALGRAFGFAGRAADKYQKGKIPGLGGAEKKDEGIFDKLKDLLSGKDEDGNEATLLGMPRPVAIIGGVVLAVYLLKGAGGIKGKAA